MGIDVQLEGEFFSYLKIFLLQIHAFVPKIDAILGNKLFFIERYAYIIFAYHSREKKINSYYGDMLIEWKSK